MGVSNSSLIGALLKINITHIFNQQLGICWFIQVVMLYLIEDVLFIFSLV